MASSYFHEFLFWDNFNHYSGHNYQSSKEEHNELWKEDLSEGIPASHFCSCCWFTVVNFFKAFPVNLQFVKIYFSFPPKTCLEM